MRVDRLLSMLLIILSKGRVTGKELADYFEVSLRTIYRDMDKISEAGIPIASEGGKGGGFYLMESFSLDNLFLKEGEIRTLRAVTDSLGFLFGRDRQFEDLLLKLDASGEKDNTIKDRLSISMSHFSMEKELKDYLQLINKAIEESRVLELEYVNRRLEWDKREVMPYYVDFSAGNWYLVGFCRSRNGFRRFKLVRIKNLKLGTSFEKQQLSMEDIKRKIHEEFKNRSIRVVLKFDSRMGAQLAEYFPKENIRTAEDGAYIAEDFFPHEEGLLRFLLGFGKGCQVLEPEYLKDEIRDYIREMLEKYGEAK